MNAHIGGVLDQTSSYRWLLLAGMILLNLMETTSSEVSAGMLTAKSRLHTGNCTGWYMTGPRGRHMFDGGQKQLLFTMQYWNADGCTCALWLMWGLPVLNSKGTITEPS